LSELKSCIDGTLAHHWIVETPKGQRELQAYCKRCEGTRTYMPTLDTSAWEGEQPTKTARAGMSLPIARVNNW
jgi:hypothetical protein